MQTRSKFIEWNVSVLNLDIIFHVWKIPLCECCILMLDRAVMLQPCKQEDSYTWASAAHGGWQEEPLGVG